MEIIKFYSKKQDYDAFKSMEYGEDNVRRNLKEYDVIQVLLNSPQIQISLGNPKMFTGERFPRFPKFFNDYHDFSFKFQLTCQY